MTTQELVKTAVRVMQDKKGSEIKVIDISKISVIADYFILVSGNSQRQTQAIADELELQLAKKGAEPRQKEGYRSGTWILLDYQDVVIHIFNSEDRRFYNLERNWPDAVKIEVQPDESVIMRARTRSYSGIRKYILGFGTGVEVLEPEWLRNAIRDWHQKAADMYRTEEEKAEVADGSDCAEKS